MRVSFQSGQHVDIDRNAWRNPPVLQEVDVLMVAACDHICTQMTGRRVRPCLDANHDSGRTRRPRCSPTARWRSSTRVRHDVTAHHVYARAGPAVRSRDTWGPMATLLFSTTDPTKMQPVLSLAIGEALMRIAA